jgi:amidase
MPEIFANRLKEFEPSASHSELDFASITELSSAMQSRRISASELLEHTIARIETLDRRFNAVVVRDFDRAREAAKAAEAALARGERHPLLGIPVTLKEPFNWRSGCPGSAPESRATI